MYPISASVATDVEIGLKKSLTQICMIRHFSLVLLKTYNQSV